MKVLILGGYGVFGGRLARLLADVEGLTLLIGGRDFGRARTFCAGWDGAARVEPVRADRGDLARVLAVTRPDVVVDASGPFQAYGPDPYAAVRAALAAGASYLDLSDGAAFVAGIGAFDAEAKARGLFVLSGASSFPVLTFAVLREAARHMEVQRVQGGIAPSPYAGVGANVLRAVLGYAGAPVALRRDGAWGTGLGLGESRTMVVAPPGVLPLPRLRFSLVDVPDLLAIPAAMPVIEDLWMGAAPLPHALHLALNAMARMRAWARLPSLAPLAPLAGLALQVARWGEHRGGMIIEVEGVRDGKPVRRSWHMVAEGDDGPMIPSMAVEGLLRRAFAGSPPEPGARAALGALTLDDYDGLFAGRRIAWGWREEREGSLYERVLDRAFDGLPPAVAALHREGGRWTGRAEVTGGRGLGRLVARAFGFPRAGRDVPVEVAFGTDARGREVWARTFGGRRMTSTQGEGRGHWAHLVVERFGPFAFGLALVRDGDRLRIVPRRWSALGLPMPGWLMPGGEAWEEENDGRFRFHVEIRLPGLGRLVRYEGWLAQAG